MTKFLHLALMIFLLSSCAAEPTLYYGHSPSIGLHNGSKVVNINVDAFGNIYPFGEFGHVRENDPSPSQSIFSQVTLFKKRNATCKQSKLGVWAKKLCEVSCNDEQLCHSSEYFLKTRKQWEEAQDKLWRAKAFEIFNLYESQDILVAIHGFNQDVEEAESTNRDMINAVLEQYEASEKSKPLVVQVFWDGTKIKNELQRLDGWGDAQDNGILVGFRLRAMFNYINDLLLSSDKQKIKYRFITHSSGAFVFATISGNPATLNTKLCNRVRDIPDWGNSAYEWQYAYDVINLAQQKGEYNVPDFTGVRALMIAPATGPVAFNGQPSKNTRLESLKKCCTQRLHFGFQQRNSKIIWTTNNNDYALKKKWFGALTMGDTSLGRYIDNKYLKDTMQLDGEISLISNDFSVDEYGKKNSIHSARDYINHYNIKTLISSLVE